MALTAFQSDICHLLAERRRSGGESYVAGGVALSVALSTSRLSRDLDLFHDTTEAVAASWDADRDTLTRAGCAISVLRERPGFVQATVSRAGETLLVEWARDSAFRFFPLVEDDTLGLTLHPFDLATNKVLALVGRVEVRDWVDVLWCDERVQPLAYLAWAACGKDPGFTPLGLLEHARRTARYSTQEVTSLAFDASPPDARDLAGRWQQALGLAERICQALPAEHVGEAVLTRDGTLWTGEVDALSGALADRLIEFHPGRIGGAWPRILT